MKVIITHHDGFSEVEIRNEKGINVMCYTFDTPKEAEAFFKGFRACNSVINGLVQSLPLSYTKGPA